MTIDSAIKIPFDLTEYFDDILIWLYYGGFLLQDNFKNLDP